MRVITGTAKGVVLKTPQGMTTRPTADRVKEGMFSAVQFDVPGARVLDLFAGTGQLGIEALSRGASHGVFVDAQKSAVSLIRENLRRTGLDGKSQVIQSDYLSYLSRCREKFDLIFLDPPYDEVFLENALKKISEIDILTDGGIIITEHPAGKELPLLFPGLVHSRDYRYGIAAVSLFTKD